MAIQRERYHTVITDVCLITESEISEAGLLETV